MGLGGLGKAWALVFFCFSSPAGHAGDFACFGSSALGARVGPLVRMGAPRGRLKLVRTKDIMRSGRGEAVVFLVPSHGGRLACWFA